MKLNYVVKNIIDIITDGKPVVFATTADFAMGSGVAKQINKVFGYKNEFKCKFEKYYPDTREVYAINTEYDSFVFCLINKRTRYDTLIKEDLEACFERLKSMMMMYGITSIFMPKIGCGADKLSWCNDVLPLLNEVFNSGEFTVNVCMLNEDEIPTDEVFDINEDAADDIVDILSEDVYSKDPVFCVYSSALNEFEDGKVIKIRIMDEDPTVTTSYKMYLETNLADAPDTKIVCLFKVEEND